MHEFMPEQALPPIAAGTLQTRLFAVRDAWRQLLSDRCGHSSALPNELLTEFVSALAAFVNTSDLTIPARLAEDWRTKVPLSIEGVAATSGALGLLGEALRNGIGPVLDENGDPIHESIATLLPSFTSIFGRTIIADTEFQPSESYWYEISRRLTAERERRITQLAILNDVSTALASTLSLDELATIIHEQCGRLFDTTNFYIATLNNEPDEMHVIYHHFGGRRVDSDGDDRLRIGLTRLVIERGEPVIFDDYVAACREHGITVAPRIDQDTVWAWIGVPIIADNQTIGLMAILSDQRTFSTEDGALLAAVARQAGAAIQNARLYQAQIIQANQLIVINRIARAFATIRDPRQLVDEAARRIQSAFGYSVVMIFQANQSDDRLVLQTFTGVEQAEDLVGFSVRAGKDGIVGMAASTRTPVVIDDVRSNPAYISSVSTQHIRSEIAVPLLREDRLLGVINVESPEIGAFSEQDVNVLTTIADQLAIALENAELLREEQKRRTEVSLILNASQAANSSLVLDDVLQRVASGIADATGLPSCVVYLFDEDRSRLLPSAFVAREGSQLDTARISQVIPSGESSRLLKQIAMSAREPCALEMMSCDVQDDLARVLCASAVLAVPFLVRDECLGFALVVSHDDAYHFSNHQLRVAFGIADSAALALENARLYARSHSLGMAEERIRLARDIHDGIAQGLTAISLHLEAAEQMFPSRPEKAQAKLHRALELTRSNLEDARRSVLDLRASALQELTLADALQHRLGQFEKEEASGLVSTSFTSEAAGGRVSSRLELSLYRIFEEALDNVARHAHATHISVLLCRTGEHIVLEITDNGSGFDVNGIMQNRKPGGKFGLIAIRERVRLLHGILTVDSSAAGTTLRVEVPFEAQWGTADLQTAHPAVYAHGEGSGS